MRPRTTASSIGSSSITDRSHAAWRGTVALLVALAFVAIAAVPAPALAAGGALTGLRGAVTPKQTVPYSVEPQRVIFRFGGRKAVPVEIRIRRIDQGAKPGRMVRRIVTGPLLPGRWHRRIWNGLDRRGRLVAAGKYRVRIGLAGGRLNTLSRIRLHGHTFPVAGPHGKRGYVGVFGAGRNGGRIHEGFDVTAACGTPLVAVRSGTVLKSAYDPELKGHYVVLKGRSERRTYLYAHLIRSAPVRKGQKVRAGRRIGTVGQTGNAASTPCHLHIEVRSRGRLLDPEPLLSSWGW